MRICSIVGCGRKHEAKGYCKCHYRSYLKYNDPLFVDNQKSSRRTMKEKNQVGIASHGLRTSRIGTCEVEGCSNPIKSKRLCEKHYARNRRTGKLTISRIERGTIMECVAVACTRNADTRGYCAYHYNNFRVYGQPHLAKTIRLCGIKGCEKPHLAKGLCQTHYHEWTKGLNHYHLSGEFKQ